MRDQSPRINRHLATLVLVSIAVTLFAVVLRVGLGNTPYETMDSAGRTMGFNDPLGTEHLLIMAGNFTFGAFFRWEHAYTWLLLSMQFLAVGILVSPRSGGTRLTRWFFALQLAIFPVGILSAIVVLPMLIGMLFTATDREGFVDIPYILIVSQGFWILTSLALLFLVKAPGLGLSKVCRGLAEALRAGKRTFVEAVR